MKENVKGRIFQVDRRKKRVNEGKLCIREIRKGKEKVKKKKYEWEIRNTELEKKNQQVEKKRNLHIAVINSYIMRKLERQEV